MRVRHPARMWFVFLLGRCIARIGAALEIPECARARRHGCFQVHAAIRGSSGAGRARKLLQFPHVLPLLLGRHFVGAVRGRGPFLFLCFLFRQARLVRCAGGGGRVEAVEGDEEEEGVD